MSKAISRTVQFLAHSNNRAATQLLRDSLRSSSETIRQAACRFVLHDPAEARELILHFDSLDEITLDALHDASSHLIAALRSALASSDKELRQGAYRVMETLRLIEMIPDVLGLMFPDVGIEIDARQHTRFTEIFFRLLDEWLTLDRNDIEACALADRVTQKTAAVLTHVLTRVTNALMPLWLRVFMLMEPAFRNQDLAIAQAMDDAIHPCYTTILRFLQTSPADRVSPIIFDRLEHAPPLPHLMAVMLGKRDDSRFLVPLFDFLASRVTSSAVCTNLHCVESAAWITSLRTLLPQLTPAQQIGAATFFQYAGVSSEERLSAVMLLLDLAESTAAKAIALRSIPREAGNEVTPFILLAIQHDDPDVQVAALTQMRLREMPNAAAILLRFLDSPHAKVQQAVRLLLPEFRLSRFLQLYDTVDETQRETFFKMVCKVEPNLVEKLTAILNGGVPVDQAKALWCIGYAKIVHLLEGAVAQLALSGHSAILRLEAVRLLEQGQTEASRNVLIQLFHRDPDSTVRAAAQETLKRRPTKT